MADLFSRTEVNFGGAMTAEHGLLIPNRGLTGLLMQNFNLNYSQNVTRLYEIGTSGAITNVYYISGRAQGSLAAAHVVGPGLVMKEFYTNFSDVCQASKNSLQIDMSSNVCDTNVTGGGNVFYLAKFCVLVGIGVAVAAADFVINESSQLTFSGLEFNG